MSRLPINVDPTGASGDIHEPKNEQAAERELTGQALTTGYIPSIPIRGLQDRRGPILMQQVVSDIEAMLLHPHIALPYSYYKAAIANCTFKVRASHPHIEAFVQNEIKRFWTRELERVQLSMDYGWGGYEANYRVQKGFLTLAGMDGFFPMDTEALTRRHKYVGISVNGVQDARGQVKLWGPKNWPAKAVWFTHRQRFNRFYGRTHLLGAHRPWSRLATRDGGEEIVDGGIYRFAYAGPLMRYPPTDFIKEDGTTDYEAGRAFAEEFVEKAKTGASVALPAQYDDKGNLLWDIKWPEHVLEVRGLLDYNDSLWKEMSYGLEVPPEIIEANETGAGWSGRKVPLIGFYVGQVRNARNFCYSWKWQIGDPLVRWNYGKGHWFEIEPQVVLPPELAGQPDGQGGKAPNEVGQDPKLGPNGKPGYSLPAAQPPQQPGQPTKPTQPGGGITLSTDSDLRQSIAQAASETDTAPSEEQKKAGNYRKGKFRLRGFTVAIENPKGSVRRGVSKAGVPWQTEMQNHYGYLHRTESDADGDHVDVFIGDEPENPTVYVVDQVDPKTGAFDEHKCMVGFASERDAANAYHANYAPSWKGFAGITAVPFEAFAAWAKDGNTGVPLCPGVALSAEPTIPAEEAGDLASPRAEAIVDQVTRVFNRLNRQVRRELFAALLEPPLETALTRARTILEKFQPGLSRLIAGSRLAGMLQGMARVAARAETVASAPQVEPDDSAPQPPAPFPALSPQMADQIPPVLPPRSTETGSDEPLHETLPLIAAAAKELASRRLLTRPQFDELHDEAHQDAFSIAGVENEKTLEKLRDALVTAVEQGETQRQFVKRAEETAGSGTLLAPARAEQVFRDAVNTSYSNGQERLLDHPVVDALFPYAAYNCIHDDRVRANHAALETLGIQGTNIYRRDDPVWRKFRPSWDWQCFVPGTEVQGRFLLGSKSWYSGDVFEITTLGGRRLTVTANHPVLASQGFVAAKNLREGDDLLCYGVATEDGPDNMRREKCAVGSGSATDRFFPPPRQDKEYAPARIEDVFSALSHVGANIRMPVRANDLHGDALFGDGQVEIVGAYRELGIDSETNGFNGPPNGTLATMNGELPRVPRLGSSGELLGADFSSARTGVRFSHPDGNGSGNPSQLVPLSSLRFGLASKINASVFQSSLNCRAIDTEGDAERQYRFAGNITSDDVGKSNFVELDGCRSGNGQPALLEQSRNSRSLCWEFLAQLPNGGTGLVSFDQIIQIRAIRYEGHVYDLQAEGGWIVAEGIFCSNCRCAWTPISIREAARRGIEEAITWLKNGVAPAFPAFVPMPPFEPDPNYQRGDMALSTVADVQDLEDVRGPLTAKARLALGVATAAVPAKGLIRQAIEDSRKALEEYALSTFDAQQHPRGQPGNKGEFASKGRAGSAVKPAGNKPASEKKQPPSPPIDQSQKLPEPADIGMADTPRIRQLIARAHAIQQSLPPVTVGHVRMWRGNRPGEVGKNPQFTNSLEGIALPFQDAYGGDLSYMDVPKADLPKYVQKAAAAADSEFRLPPELASKAKVVEAARKPATNAPVAPPASSQPAQDTLPGWGSV